jgi:hypothetical protein
MISRMNLDEMDSKIAGVFNCLDLDLDNQWRLPEEIL